MRPLLVLIIAALLGTVAGSGQTGAGPLTLEDCIRLAQSAQSAASVAARDVDIARLGVRAARAGYFPQTAFNNGYIYNSPTGGDPRFVSANGVREYSSLFAAALQIDTSGRVRAEVARARADEDAAGVNYRIAQRDLKRAVATAFYRLALTRKLVEVGTATLDESRSFERRTKLLNENGEAALADVIKASAEVAFLEQALNSAELDAQTANHDLASFWTSDVDQHLEIVDPLNPKQPPPDAPAADSPFLKRLEFNLYSAQRQGFLADYRRARADLLPQAGVIYQYGFDARTYDWSARGSSVSVNLNVPIFDWFRAISTARQARIRADVVTTSVRIAERNFSREYQSALARVRHLYDQIEIAQRQASLSGENLKLSRIRYEGGEGLALDVVQAQVQVAQARTNYLTAIANYLNAKADLEVAAGR